MSNATATIEISTVNNSISITLSPNEVHLQDFGDFNPTLGVEDKAIRIISDIELLIVVYRGDHWYSDAYTVPSRPSNSSVYFTTAYITDNPCDSNREKEFYLVASFYDDTFVSVIQQDGVTYEVELPRFGTFLQTTTDANDHLASGTMITSSKPISVISGNLCTKNRGSTGMYASNIPSLETLGQVYVVPRIISGFNLDRGFSVSVVATANNTLVESDGEVQSLDQGHTAIFEYPDLARSILVNCSETCLVAQYSKSNFVTGFGMFMFHVLPNNEFITSAYFRV